MPITSYVTPTTAVHAIGARTDAAGGAVADLSAEEVRLLALILTEGYLFPATAFRVQAQTTPDMTVKVGSGTAKADHFVVAGEVVGQGNYVVRLDVASQNVTIDAADASQARTDEVYLVVRDNVYDTSSRALPQIGYRKGDVGGGNPGPDMAWKASVLLARVAVAANATTITAGNITDQRAASGFISALTSNNVLKSTLTAKGDLYAATAASSPARVGVGTDGAALKADSGAAAGVSWSDIGVSRVKVLTASDASTSISYEDIGTSGEAFVFTAPANSRWAVEAFLLLLPGSANVNLVWGHGAGVNILWSALGPMASAAANSGDIDYRYLLEDNSYTVGNIPYGGIAVRVEATIAAPATPQVVGLQFASAVGGSSVTVLVGSWFKYTRLA